MKNNEREKGGGERERDVTKAQREKERYKN